MKLVSFRTSNGEVRPGVVLGDQVVDLRAADPSLPADLSQILALGAPGRIALEAAAASGVGRTRMGAVTLTAPVRPRKFMAIGLNYADHVAEAGLATPEYLTVFSKASTCVTGPFDVIERPFVSDQLDYEGELGFVIGQRCRHVSAEDAPSVIAGYLVVNDVSVRDWQTRTQQWNLGKSFDTHGPIGPWLVTPEEVGDPHDLGIRTFVNGERRQHSSTRNLIFDCYEQVAILSTVCTLEPGDVIATGTSSGVAAHMAGTPWLVPGDVVRVEIDRIGAIENRVVDEPRPPAERTFANGAVAAMSN